MLDQIADSLAGIASALLLVEKVLQVAGREIVSRNNEIRVCGDNRFPE